MAEQGWSDERLLAALAQATRQAGEPTGTMAAAADAAFSGAPSTPSSPR